MKRLLDLGIDFEKISFNDERVRKILSLLSQEDDLPSVYHLELELDVSDMNGSEIIERLSTLDIGEKCFAIWPSEGFAISMLFVDLIRHFESLWSPSMDDLVVVNSENRRILFFSHEEIVKLFSER